MKKFIIIICILSPVIIAGICNFIIPLINVTGIKNDLTSKEMRNEIIRQMKEKEGKTIQDYHIEEYFKRITE